ncbi:MAG: ABC transporter permease [Opitutaceae bacterium]
MLSDLKNALRQLAKSPGFTAIAVLSLAVGFGVNSTIFSALDAALFRSLPFKDANEIVRVYPQLSYPEYLELRASMPSLAGLVAVGRHVALVEGPDGTEEFACDVVSQNYFSVLGIAPAMGRLFSDRTDGSPGEPTVVISYGLWQSRFGGDPQIVGRTITMDRSRVTVLGVAAKGFGGDRRIPVCDLWKPAEPQESRSDRTVRDFELIGRLRPGATAAQAQDQAAILLARIAPDAPKLSDGRRALVQSEIDSSMAKGAAGLLAMSVVGLVLIVACANVACLLLARNEGRRRETAVRLALGAGRWRLMRQFLVEGAMLSLLGAAAGLLLTIWTIHLVPLLMPPMGLSHLVDLRVDGRVIGLTLGLSCFATIAFGLFPAWRATRVDVGPLLKSDISPAFGKARWFTVRNALVSGQVAVALIFLALAALFVRGFGNGQKGDFGFTQKNLLLPLVEVNGGREGPDACDQLQARLRALPGVRAVGLGTWVPFALSGGGASLRVVPPGNSASGGSQAQPVQSVSVEPGYFATLGIRLIRGRDFTARDDAAGARVAIVSEAIAKRFWPGEDPVGKIFRAGNGELAPREVVGVAHDLVEPIQSGVATAACLYFPFRQEPRSEVRFLIVTQGGDRAALAGLVRAEIRRFNDRLLLLDMTTMDAQLRVALFLQWVGAWLGGVLGLLAFVLALSGLYGVVAQAVSRRTRELGIRMALGARPVDALWLVLRQGLMLSLAGIAVGLPVAAAAGFAISRGLYGIQPADPVALACSSLLVIAVSLLASYFPARRATKIDPVTALRAE